jgi:hypothetical protein
MKRLTRLDHQMAAARRVASGFFRLHGGGVSLTGRVYLPSAEPAPTPDHPAGAAVAERSVSTFPAPAAPAGAGQSPA